MVAAGVPTAASQTFTDLAPALAYVDRHAEPLVVKASGLAGGKGAVVCATRAEAARAVRAMLEGDQFGPAGRTVVIEAFLEGEEISVLALTDGRDVELLPVAQDHKRLLEGDRGPNTGGMGAYSPVALATPALLERVKREVLYPTLEQMQRQRTPFSGVLYAGLMIDAEGTPSVVEFNCRLGDPEAQVVLPLVSGGLTDSLMRVAEGKAPSPLQTGDRGGGHDGPGGARLSRCPRDRRCHCTPQESGRGGDGVPRRNQPGAGRCSSSERRKSVDRDRRGGELQ